MQLLDLGLRTDVVALGVVQRDAYRLERRRRRLRRRLEHSQNVTDLHHRPLATSSGRRDFKHHTKEVFHVQLRADDSRLQAVEHGRQLTRGDSEVGRAFEQIRGHLGSVAGVLLVRPQQVGDVLGGSRQTDGGGLGQILRGGQKLSGIGGSKRVALDQRQFLCHRGQRGCHVVGASGGTDGGQFYRLAHHVGLGGCQASVVLQRDEGVLVGDGGFLGHSEEARYRCEHGKASHADGPHGRGHAAHGAFDTTSRPADLMKQAVYLTQ